MQVVLNTPTKIVSYRLFLEYISFNTYIFNKVLKLGCERLTVKLRTKEVEHIGLGTLYLITAVFLSQTTR